MTRATVSDGGSVRGRYPDGGILKVDAAAVAANLPPVPLVVAPVLPCNEGR